MNKIEELIEKLCPDGVEFRELGDIGKVCMCKRVMKHETAKVGEIPFFKIGTFGKEPDAYISRELYENHIKKYSFPKKGEILISASGTIGRIVIYNGEPAYFQDSNIVWIANDESIVINKFLSYYYKIVEWKIDGGTISRLYNDNLAKTKIPIPPLPIQQEIVNILDSFTQLEAELEAELEARKKQYEYYRNDLLNFEGKEVDWKTINEIAFVVTGGEAPANCIKSLLPNETYKYPIFANGSEVYGYTDNYKINKDSVTISSIGANTGTIYYRKAFFTPIIRLKVLLPRTADLSAKYLFYYLSSITITSKKSSVPNLNADDVKKLKIPIPPLAEQERIVTMLDKFDALVNDTSMGLPAEIQARRKQYEFYRGRLLDFKNVNAVN